MIKVTIISTVRSPIKQLRLFVNYHLNVGIDHIILFFDDPLDEGINAFAQYEKVSTVKCSSAYWLEKTDKRPEFISERYIINVNEGVKLALEKNCNWIIHIDSDELINPLKELKQVLSDTNAEAVRFSILEAVSENEKYDHIFQPILFKKNPNRLQVYLAKFLGCSNVFFDNQYFRGHTASKMAVKISPDIKQYRVHNAEKYYGKLIIENSNEIQLLHYDCVGINTWMMKWDRRLDGTGKSKTLGEQRKKQLVLYEQTKVKGKKDLSLLYQKLHMIPMREQVVLYRLGMLKTIKLKQKLFEKYDKKRENNVS